MEQTLTFEAETMTAWVGIDVSQETLDVECLQEGKRRGRRRVKNTEQGCAELVDWLLKERKVDLSQTQVSLEATGWYSDLVSTLFYEQGCRVSVLNPSVLTNYREVKELRSKTDKHDASLLAIYGKEQKTRRWVPVPESVRILRELLANRDDVQQLIRRERNRLASPRLVPITRNQVEERLAVGEKQFKEIEKQIKTQIKEQADLKEIAQRLEQIDGVGWLTAARLVARIVDIARFPKVGALVSLAGLSITEHQSGTSVKGRPHIDRHGHSDLRACLYMGALSLLRANKKASYAWAQRLLGRGKPKKVVIVALMRKLLHIVYGVWKTQTPYDASQAFACAA
jgi:transposase